MRTFKQGTVIRFGVNVGSYAAPSYTDLEGETSFDLNFSMGTIDVTNKDSDNWKEVLPGIREVTFSFAAVYDEAGSAAPQTITDIMARTLTKAQIDTLDGYKYSGDVYMTGVSISAPHDGPVTITGDATFTGTVTQAAA